MTPLEQLARDAGLQVVWEDSDGQTRTLSPDTQRQVLRALGYAADDEEDIAESRVRLARLTAPETVDQWPAMITAVVNQPIVLPGMLPQGTPYTVIPEEGDGLPDVLDASGCLRPISLPGYYVLDILGHELTLAVAPTRCPGIQELAPRRKVPLSGLGVQLYSLRRFGNNRGMGDIEALALLAEAAAAQGIDALAISPVHALFPTRPHQFSPYSPSSRLAFNPGYTSLGEPDEPGSNTALIDYPAVLTSRWAALTEAFYAMDAAERDAFEAFCREEGLRLERHACFEAMLELLGPREDWPTAYNQLDSEEVRQFVQVHREHVERYQFAQWCITRELVQAQQRARRAGMAVGLIADIAVGVDPQGSQAWAHPEDVLDTIHVGSPPDAFNANGQDWGVAGFSPQGLLQHGFRGFIETVRAALKGAGGLRIDHIMGLSRLWLIPQGAAPTEGAYVRYPEQDLLRLVALEAWQHQALVIGEDLGTVELDFRTRLDQSGILGMGVLWFEREAESFTRAADYPARAVSMASTHDLPTVAGWLAGRDIHWRHRLGMLGDTALDEAMAERARERTWLAEALNIDADSSVDRWLEAVAYHIGATPAPLALLPLEDLLGLVEQPNLPGTLDEHPNWQRRLPVNVERLFDSETVRMRLKALIKGRQEHHHG
ncbi:4-alpha-glucanotransferase [Larsenimonas rhizosphaerae]|uniref:4-alpha-glucanotransferase n=1 Tax=Larsenimonas rhizosphaerae TaxID=2944682 RepID=UPI002033F0D6|nr:4-alpha-glucanotransferase [Larsenimonas rhizosphaerae]MCM2130250.1 4-alpha-glucanotransferase [Larsenimonas rhizosphaerae]